MSNDISPENTSIDASTGPTINTPNTTTPTPVDIDHTGTTDSAIDESPAMRHTRSVDEPLDRPLDKNENDHTYVPKHYANDDGDGNENAEMTSASDDLPEPTIESIENAAGPMTSILYDPTSEIYDPMSHARSRSRNRAARRAGSKKKIGPDAVRRQTQERIEASQRTRQAKELPEDVRDLLGKITAPEVTARTKDTPLHKWSREDALNMFFTLGHVHAKMMCPIPDDEGTVVPAVSLIQAGDSVGVFYPVTEDSQSHILTTVHDPRHYMSAAERDLVNDGALQALSETAEQIVTGVYSLAGSLTPGSDAREIADLMGQLDEMHAKD